jgi:TonB family protein
MASNDKHNRPERNAPSSDRRTGRASAEIVPGSLASLETTLPPTPLKDLLAADGASIYVYSVDDALLTTVQEAGGEQYPVHSVAEWPSLLSAIDRDLCHIVLIDADALPADLEKQISDLRALEPSLVILLAAPRDTAQKLIGLLSDRSIHRLLIKPAASGITRLLLESAVSRYLQLRERTHEGLEEQIEHLRRRPREGQQTRWLVWLLATALVSLLLAAVVVGSMMRWRIDDPTSEADAGQSSADATLPVSGETIDGGQVRGEPIAAAREPVTPTPEDPVEPFAAELAQAALALVEGRIVAPEGVSALDIYAGILSEDPQHAEANAQLGIVLDTLFSGAEAALLEGRLDAAEETIAQIRRARPATSRLAFIETQLTRAREAATIAARADDIVEPQPAAAVPVSAPPSEFDSLLTIAESRIERGQFTEPAGDSALAYFERASALAPDDPRLLALRTLIAEGVASQARVVLDGGDIERATELTSIAFRLGANTELLTLLELDLANSIQQSRQREIAELLALAESRLRENRWLTPEDDSALFYLTAVRREQADFPGLAPLMQEFSQALGEQVRTAIAANDWPAAESLLSTLQQAGADPVLIRDLQIELVNERRQIQFLTQAAPSSALELVEYELPQYPPAALRLGIEGWVDLQFIVGQNGRPRDIAVIASQPEERFDQAAITAVSQYRYAPFELGGRVYERTVTLRVRFTLQ